MEPWEIEVLRRSVVMTPPGSPAAAMTRTQALALFDELASMERRTARYRQIVQAIRELVGE